MDSRLRMSGRTGVKNISSSNCHPRRFLAGIHSKKNQDGFPINNVGNDKCGIPDNKRRERQKMDSQWTMSGMTRQEEMRFIKDYRQRPRLPFRMFGRTRSWGNVQNWETLWLEPCLLWMIQQMSHHPEGDHDLFFFTRHTNILQVFLAPICRF